MSDRLLPQITDRLEWNLVARQEFQADRIVGGRGRISWYIPTQTYLISNSHVVLVGMKNDRAFAHWQLGCWASQKLLFRPSSTTQFEFSSSTGSRRIKLNVLNLLVFPRYDQPWNLELSFPKWHEKAFIEVWKYDGLDVDVFERLNDLESQFESVADAIDGGI